MSVLDGAGFRAAGLDQAVRHFYEHTACWRMEVWAQWSAPFQPGGELVSLYRDHRGVLRTDHELRLYRALVLRLHYRMEPA